MLHRGILIKMALCGINRSSFPAGNVSILLPADLSINYNLKWKNIPRPFKFKAQFPA